MAKKMVRTAYVVKDDTFLLQYTTDGGKNWNTECEYQCRACAENPDGEKNFIAFSIVTRLDDLVLMGYEYARRAIIE